jgi:hypothetical protein
MQKIIEELIAHRRFYIGLFGIIMIATFLRLWGLGSVPLVADEFLDVNATYGYFKTGQWQAWDFNHGEPSSRLNEASDGRAWIYRWQVAQLYHYLSPTEFTIRLVSALWGIFTTIILYFVTLSYTKNRWIAFMAAFFWAVSVPAIEINRKIRMYSMFAPVFLLFMWSLFQFIESAIVSTVQSGVNGRLWQTFFSVRWLYIVPAILFGTLAMHLHALTGNFVLVVFVYFIVMIYCGGEGVMRKRYMAYAGVIGAGLLLVKFVRPADWAYFVQSLSVTEHVSYVGHILRNYWHPLLGGAVMLLGTWVLVRDKEHARAGVWIGCSFFVILFMAMFFWSRNVGAQYIFFAQPFGLILASAGVVYLAEYTQKITQKRKAFFFVIFACCVFLPNYGYFLEENNTYHITAQADTVDYRKVFDYVKRNYTNGEVLITRNFRNYYWSGLDAQVFDFGSERSEEQLAQEGKVKKITLAYVQEIIREHPAGWVVIADNDETFIEKEAQNYFDANFERVKGSSLLNGDVRVYRWGTH